VKAEGWGTLKGKVVFDGAAPEVQILVAKGDANAKDSAVCAKEAIKSEKFVVDGGSKGVKNVLVWINKPTAINPEAKSAVAMATAVFDQKGCVFEPHVMGMMVGATVNIKSSDPVPHNVNSKVDNNVLNQAIAANSSTPFKPAAAARQPGLVVCDIHPWMNAYWLVVDHPYFAVTNEKGEFEIKNVPAGTQKIVVWAEATKYLTPTAGKEINIKPNDVTTEEVKVQASQVK
jgi:plastocyanin